MDKYNKILIFDDEKVFSERLRPFLVNYNYSLILKENPVKVINNLKGNEISAIIINPKADLKTPMMRLINEIKDNYETCIMLLTDESIYLEKDFDKYIRYIIDKNTNVETIAFNINKTIKSYKIETEKYDFDDIVFRQREQFLALFESSKDPILFLDMRGRILEWNKAATKLFGYKAIDVQNRKIWDLIISFRHKNEFFSSFQQWKYTDEQDLMKKSMELYCTKENGDLIPVMMTLSITELKNERFISVYISDISERIAANEEIEKLIEEMQVSKEIIENNASEVVILNSKLYESEEQLKELNASKDKFFSIIAHDLKSPFQTLLGYSEILSKEIESLEKDDIKSFADNLYKSSESLFKLLENLLDWSRLQRGVMEYNPDNHLLFDIIYANTNFASIKAKDKNIEIVEKCENDIWVYCDYNMINTVLRNLISNSLKFTKPGGKIEVYVEIDENITIIVKDNGVGMSEKAMNKIFKIDTHHSTLGTNNEQGTGLGLILCKELVDKNYGSIKVESEEGVGTSFYITLPKGSYPKILDET